jgi:hypothetical protein
MTRNAAFSNREMPGQVKPGETAFPPLPLNLYYLITAFGRDNDSTQPFGHELMGKAMSTLHDHALLGADEIRSAIAATLPRADLDRQIERIRITFQPLSIEEISKLWTGFATQYRLSAAYEVAVALIESTQPVKTPLPALTRGRGDSGVRSTADLTPPLPALETIEFPNQQNIARLNDVLALNGHDLDGTNVGVVFNHQLWAAPVEIPIPAGPNATAKQVKVAIPNDAVNWPSGVYTMQVLVQRAGDSYRRSSNTLPFSLGPTITISPASAPAGNITFVVTSSPEVRPTQRASLLLGSQEILADPHPVQTANVTFAATAVTTGEYFIRLRVDGVDSLLVNKGVKPPAFDPSQKVTIT